jgi:hypothetical protein
MQTIQKWLENRVMIETETPPTAGFRLAAQKCEGQSFEEMACGEESRTC